MQFSFLGKNEDGTLQFQGFNMAALISYVYDIKNKAVVVLIKHKFKQEVPSVDSKGKRIGTKLVDQDFEMVINRYEDMQRFLAVTSPWMTPLEISTLLDETSDMPSAPVLEPTQPNP